MHECAFAAPANFPWAGESRCVRACRLPGRRPARRARTATCARAGDGNGESDDENSSGRGDVRWTPSSGFGPDPWDDVDLSEGLSDEEAASLRAKLPGPVAEFLIRRAGGTRRSETLMAKLVRDGEPEPPEWDDFVYDARPAPPGVAADGFFDGIPTEGAVDVDPTSLFVGRESEKEMQARQVGYAALALVLLFVLFRIVGAFITFFVSFTFSFLAIFALSAGLFVVFVLFRFF